MKRPRRPEKARLVKRARKEVPEFGFDDPKPPKGVSFQWVPDPKIDPTREGEWCANLRAGWRPVSAKRYPKFPSQRGRIAFRGMVLMQLSEKRQRALVDAAIAVAKEQIKSYRDLFQMDRAGERGFPLVSPEFMVSSNYETVPPDAEAIDVPVMIKLRLSRRFQDAAAALRLTAEQYAQRRISLFLRGDLGGLLLPAPPEGSSWPESLEIHEHALFTVTSKV